MDIQQPLVSILIPIYGVEQYIERCARSVFGQTYKNIEIIFINDCTPDNSIIKLKSLLDEFPQIKSKVQIIDHEYNKGLAGARLTGLNASKGIYVMQYDSDDYVSIDMIEKMVNCATKENADITICDFAHIYKDKIIHKPINPPLNPLECMYEVLTGKIHGSLCNKLIKRSLYTENQIMPKEGLNMMEDLYVMYQLLYKAQKLAYVPEALYFYNLTNTTSMTSIKLNAKTQENYITILKQMELFKQKNTLPPFIYDAFEIFKLSKLINILFYGDWVFIKREKNIFSSLNYNSYLKARPYLATSHKAVSICYFLHLKIIIKVFRFIRKYQRK